MALLARYGDFLQQSSTICRFVLDCFNIVDAAAYCEAIGH